MNKKELSAKYDHQSCETSEIYQSWVDAGYFTAGDKTKDPFCIVIPPPNVTGKLHLGHAWDTTLQDIISRYQRMKGKDMLWLSGMDHAGIATQAKVDARLKEEGISRHDIGREKFLERAWEWKEEYASFIRKQWAKMGLSLDYSRERFTLDDGLSAAVKKVFVDLYNEGLIYQGERIINWDVQAQTALSNIEVIHKEIEGGMYTFKYTVEDTGEQIHVATTRPETMFGDVCVVVHPDDPRYTHIHGKYVINPANHERLNVITDDYIDIEFGTGAMKCTPAHDPNDFMLGEKHHLPRPVCMNPDGTMNALAGEFAGMERFACRKELVKRIEEEGNLVGIEKILHQVGHSERTDVIVEPYLSKQWFVRMKPLANDVLQAQGSEGSKIQFYPERFAHTFEQWLENIEDWCISRQLWWGHRIPAYYHKETGAIHVGDEPADIENYRQDEDVLDTWFSSALWPFSTLGWPEETEDFKRYYPTSVLVTGYDIIFFWVARMAFQARYFTKNYPFKDVLIHGLIRDSQGRKMSKSLGNGVDPMDVIDQYGVDALRFFLTTNSTPGQDMRYMEEKVESSWNFINKIWNAARFVLMNVADLEETELAQEHLSITDKWILGRLDETLEAVNANMNKYEFALVGNELYSFIWDDFCSWYIELSKSALSSTNAAEQRATRATLLAVLNAILKMLHPFMPFVTEEIYAALPHTMGALCTASWPTASNLCDDRAKQEVADVISMIQAVREIRVSYQVKPSQPLEILLQNPSGETLAISAAVTAILKKMANAEVVEGLHAEDCVIRPIRSGRIGVELRAIVNEEEEIKKLQKEQEKLQQEIKRCEGMLANPSFVNKAPAAKIAEETSKLQGYQQRLAIVSEELEKYQK